MDIRDRYIWRGTSGPADGLVKNVYVVGNVSSFFDVFIAELALKRVPLVDAYGLCASGG